MAQQQLANVDALGAAAGRKIAEQLGAAIASLNAAIATEIEIDAKARPVVPRSLCRMCDRRLTEDIPFERVALRDGRAQRHIGAAASLGCLGLVGMLDAEREALVRVAVKPDLSDDVREIITKSLEAS